MEELKIKEGSFMLFPKLAIELRLRIWRLSFPPTRVLELPVIVGGSPLEYKRSSVNPVALFVNHESRSEALRIYRPLMRRSCYAFRQRKAISIVIYFNPNTDIIRIREIGASPFWNARPIKSFVSDGGIIDHIKHITSYNVLWYELPESKFLATKDEDMCFHYFKALEKINLVFFENYTLCKDSIAQDCKATVERYLEKHKKANPDYRSRRSPTSSLR
ncbi:hypothetical protein N431DRAFT_533189 [Stipitochalara longipes BDJ]|nr:hypothetical protein N431DRAFT_533189 [Stipitochalara longipes BDJ]